MAVQTVILPTTFAVGVNQNIQNQLTPLQIAAQFGAPIIKGLVQGLLPGDQGPTQFGDPDLLGCDPQCPPGFSWSKKKGCCVKTRRRRRRMLTCSDKADIAFLTATLGKGEMAKSAIGSLLAGGCR